jgi:hypothetical protein
VLTIAPILLLALAVVLLVRKGGMRWWHAATSALFGFYLASTSIAPNLDSGLAQLTGWVGSIQL